MNETERRALLGILKVFYGEARYTGTSAITEDARHTQRAIAAIRDLLDTRAEPGLDADRVIRKLGSLQGKMIEIKLGINALQVETERLEDSVRIAVSQAPTTPEPWLDGEARERAENEAWAKLMRHYDMGRVPWASNLAKAAMEYGIEAAFHAVSQRGASE